MKNKRVITIGLFLTIIWVGMSVRMFDIQVLKRKHFSSLSHKQSVTRNIMVPQRGEIFDRNGEKLIMNADVQLDFKEGKKKKHRNLKRVAPHGTLAGQVLGNIGKDGYGQLGLEYNQDKVLRGIDGWKYARLDVSRKYHPGFSENKNDPVDGLNIITTINAQIQKIAEQALEKGVKRVQAKGGVALIVSPKTGDVVAMANYPLYNPNRRSSMDMKGWKNKAVAKTYEPGSTFKIITSAVAIEENVVKPEATMFAENGNYKLHGADIKDTKARGNISFTDGLAFSSNIIMVKAAMKIDPQAYYKYLRSFGFGMKTGVALPAEESGRLKVVRNWSARTQITLAWGQEISVTPLQIVMAVSAVANEGILMKPRIILGHKNNQGMTIKRFPPRKVRRVVSKVTAEKVKKMMETVVEYGTARRIKTERYSIAGKTGTVEKIDKNTGKYVKGKFHSSFIGMVPSQSPEYVCLVLVNEPQKDKHGGSCAAPIFRDIMDRIVSMPGSELAAKIEKINSKDGETSKEIYKASFTDKLLASFQKIKEKVPSKNVKKAGFSSSYLTDAISGAGNNQNRNNSNTNGKDIHTLSASHNADYRVTSGEWKMPDVRKLSLRDALLKLRDLNIDIEYKGVGQVKSQLPKPSILVTPKTKCILYLGAG